MTFQSNMESSSPTSLSSPRHCERWWHKEINNYFNKRSKTTNNKAFNKENSKNNNSDDANKQSNKGYNNNVSTWKASWSPNLFLCVFILLLVKTARGALPCENTEFCQQMIHPKSVCLSDMTCSNPYSQGCLATVLGEDRFNPRVCNSDDDNSNNLIYDANDNEIKPNCIQSDFNYTELRIHHANWESSIFFAWILQIFLSERLQVPATIGLQDNAPNSFYSQSNTLPYSSETYPFEAVKKAHEVIDCRLTDEPCVHVLPEVWNGAERGWKKGIEEGYLDPVEGNGQVGKISWYIPAFTAKHDPDLVSFYGMVNQRKKLAETFLRPTTWKDYCELVSPTNCTVADDVALSYPESGQDDKYFSDGSFYGHFRYTDKNNCTLNEDTCTGHFVGPPCTWSTNIEAQFYWNNIALESNGPTQPTGSYSYGQMIDIWKAAVRNKQHVIIWWWKPEALVEQFRGTDAEFQVVLLPEATQQCSAARIGTTEERCSANIWTRRGPPDSGCDFEAHALNKVFAKSLGQATSEVPKPDRSPGHETIRNVKVSDLQLDLMLKEWTQIGVDLYGNDARYVVCEWVAEHINELDQFLPIGYPRILSRSSSFNATFLHVAKVLGLIGMVVAVAAISATYYWRESKVMVYAQPYFVFMILGGYFLICMGAIVVSLQPSTFVCTTQEWFVALGYTIELVPLLVKISAINAVLQSARKMKRVRISPLSMAIKVAIVVFMILVYLTVWTIVDAPTDVESRQLQSEEGQIVESTLSCSSKSKAWAIVPLGWEAFLLIGATVLAFQSRNIMQDFNESRSLATLVYSHFLFMALRGILYFFSINGTFAPNILAGTTSFLLSADTIIAQCIYILPKFLEAQKAPAKYTRRSSVVTSVALSQIEAGAAQERAAYVSTFTQSQYGDSSSRQFNSRTSASHKRINFQDDSTDPSSGSQPFRHEPPTANTLPRPSSIIRRASTDPYAAKNNAQSMSILHTTIPEQKPKSFSSFQGKDSSNADDSKNMSNASSNIVLSQKEKEVVGGGDGNVMPPAPVADNDEAMNNNNANHVDNATYNVSPAEVNLSMKDDSSSDEESCQQQEQQQEQNNLPQTIEQEPNDSVDKSQDQQLLEEHQDEEIPQPKQENGKESPRNTTERRASRFSINYLSLGVGTSNHSGKVGSSSSLSASSSSFLFGQQARKRVSRPSMSKNQSKRHSNRSSFRKSGKSSKHDDSSSSESSSDSVGDDGGGPRYSLKNLNTDLRKSVNSISQRIRDEILIDSDDSWSQSDNEFDDDEKTSPRRIGSFASNSNDQSISSSSNNGSANKSEGNRINNNNNGGRPSSGTLPERTIVTQLSLIPEVLMEDSISRLAHGDEESKDGALHGAFAVARSTAVPPPPPPPSATNDSNTKKTKNILSPARERKRMIESATLSLRSRSRSNSESHEEDGWTDEEKEKSCEMMSAKR